jgi:alkanesulfonate monooxygenase SsuD/methylene tetrahydromethanopterin reductase-like flavin-dependent oxidoreductase (luciferase family)
MRGADVGIYIPQVTGSYEEVLAQAHRVEELGLGSFWLFDHLYTPMLPDRPALEAWTLATALLANTTELRVGHLVLDNNLRHPALLAQMIATLDVVSAGRLELGLGSGSVALEHEQTGLPWGTMAERSSRLAEALAIVTGLLVGDDAGNGDGEARSGRSAGADRGGQWNGGGFTFVGEHYEVRDLPCRPGPVQRPHPPLHIGGIGPRYTLPLVAQYADVWNVPTYGLDDWPRTAAAVDACCEAVGRDPSTLLRSHQAVLVLAPDEASVPAALERALRRYPGPGFGVEAGGYVGTPEQVADRMRAMGEAGIERFIFMPYDRGSGDVLDLLAGEVLPLLAG